MNLIPKMDVDNNVVGHIPNRDSKNPVIGVFRCDCSDVATVHNPKGKRSGHYYSICSCGTDQRSGEHRQKWFRENMRETVEELETENNPVPEPVSISSEGENSPDENPISSEPPEIAKNAVSTVNETVGIDQQINQPENPEKTENKPDYEPVSIPPQAHDKAASAVNEQEQQKSKHKPIILALLGALAGGLLGMA